MRISTKGEYGIRAVLELAHRHGEGYVQSADIARARDIPENYLYQLLITLRKAGLIRSRRGPKGGHMLARPPEHVNMAEVVICLEGPLAPVSCVQDEVYTGCEFSASCAVRSVWQRVTTATQSILEDTSFGDLVAMERANCEPAQPA
jgi:Rrf2 family transcriptional regulator, cysteine metabolism repressor